MERNPSRIHDLAPWAAAILSLCPSLLVRIYLDAFGGNELLEVRRAAVPVREVDPERELRFLEGLDDPPEAGYGHSIDIVRAKSAEAFKLMSAGGSALMELGSYPFSRPWRG